MDQVMSTELRVSLHELNNIFTIIVSSADLMLLDAEKDTQSEQDLKNILRACERGKKLVEDLRARNLT